MYFFLIRPFAKFHCEYKVSSFHTIAIVRVQCKVLLITSTKIYRNARSRGEGITGGACQIENHETYLQLFKKETRAVMIGMFLLVQKGT